MGTNQLVNIRAKLILTPVLYWYGDLFAVFHINRLSSLNTKYYINNWLPWKQIGPNAVCSVLIFLAEAQKTQKASCTGYFNQVITIITENNSSNTFLLVSRDLWKIPFFPPLHGYSFHLAFKGYFYTVSTAGSRFLKPKHSLLFFFLKQIRKNQNYLAQFTK